MKKTWSKKKRGNKAGTKKKVPLRSGDVLVTQKMLSETKSELKSEITSVRLEVKALRKDMDSKFAQMDSKFVQMDSKLELVIAAIHRTNALVEEQNSRNRVVLEGYDQLYRKQEKFDQRLTDIEKIR